MINKSIVDSKLFIKLDLSPTPLANNRFLKNPAIKAHLASQWLLYDQVVIPTTDFGIVPALIDWLGMDIFKDALKSMALQFIRREGLLAYNGGGLGIGLIKIERGQAEKWEWWREAQFQSDDISLELQLHNNLPNQSRRQRRILVRDVLRRTSHLGFESGFFTKHITHESYQDVLDSSLLSQTALSLNNHPSFLDLQNLIPANQTRVLKQNANSHDAVDLVLRIAEINMELVMGRLANDADLLTSQGAEIILKEKLARFGVQRTLLDSFMSLMDLNNIPDIRPAIKEGVISMKEIWKLRQSSKSIKFREWLRTVGALDSRELERAYVEAIGRTTLADSLPVRVLRFASTSLSGIINPLLSLATSVADSFFIDALLKGYSPKLFLDELQKLMIERK